MHGDEFLREVAPLLGLQPRPFQRRGVRRKVERRLTEIGLSSVDEYLARIKEDPEEKAHLSTILTVTISSFFRDKEVFKTIETSVLPALLTQKGSGNVGIWSMNCSSWFRLRLKNFPSLRLQFQHAKTDTTIGMHKYGRPSTLDE